MKCFKSSSLIFTLLIFTLLNACGGGFDFRQDDNFNYFTLGMTAEEAATAIETVLSAGNPPAVIEPQAELQQGEIYVQGQVRRQRDDELIPGSLVLRLWAQDGVMQAAVSDLDFAGWDASDQQLNKMNADIAAGVARRAAQNNRQSELTEVSITPEGMRFTWRSPRPQR